jgi:hypothetical protein
MRCNTLRYEGAAYSTLSHLINASLGQSFYRRTPLISAISVITAAAKTTFDEILGFIILTQKI